MRYTFRIRRGVRFHDGVELTAEDAEFTLREVLDPETESRLARGLSMVDGVEAIDRYTLEISLKEPSPTFLINLSALSIAPKHLLEGGMTPDFAHHPTGSGSFKFESWGEDDTITLVANEDYFAGRPNLDRIVVTIYPDKKSLWAGLLRGEVDLADDLSFEDFKALRDNPLFKATTYTSNFYYLLLFNLKNPLLGQGEIRRAIDLALNRERIVSYAAQGYGEEASGPFPRRSWAYNPEVRTVIRSWESHRDTEKYGLG